MATRISKILVMNPNKKQHIIGGLLWIVVITAVGYLLCSLLSLDFDRDDWNWLSKIIFWIVGFIDCMLLADIIQIPSDKNSNRYE